MAQYAVQARPVLEKLTFNSLVKIEEPTGVFEPLEKTAEPTGEFVAGMAVSSLGSACSSLRCKGKYWYLQCCCWVVVIFFIVVAYASAITS